MNRRYIRQTESLICLSTIWACGSHTASRCGAPRGDQVLGLELGVTADVRAAHVLEHGAVVDEEAPLGDGQFFKLPLDFHFAFYRN